MEPKTCTGKHFDLLGNPIPCQHKVARGEFCIFHAPPEEKSHEEMMEGLRSLTRQWSDENLDFWNFSGFSFAESVSAKELAHKTTSTGEPLFEKPTSFKSTSFSGTANFNTATFSGNADFSSAMFPGRALFESTLFEGDATFWSAEFREGVTFESCQFRKSARFEKVHVYIRLVFDECVTRRALNMTSSRFFGKVNLSWRGIRRDHGAAIILLKGIECVERPMELLKTEKPQLTLIDGSRGDDCKPVIEGCKKNAMRCIMLNEIDVMRIAFRGNEWPKEDDFFFKKIPSTRTLCGDELELPRQNSPSEEDYGKVRETYQQLSKRFREDLNFAYSIEFDRGAFEMRRKELWKKKGLINWSTGVWLTLYKYASHYSGNLLLPVVWWVVLVILF
ncbi:MAG: pentapeptide repeat-containing protein, partial [Calditrichaeota bacterium]|nr:pentapeptide repeat-containing protein [Calditrichota bacterium]